jgi:hypothetical protein
VTSTFIDQPPSDCDPVRFKRLLLEIAIPSCDGFAVGTETQLAPFLSSFVPRAVALLLSLGLGRVASSHGIPRVTVYLLVGFLLGPQLGMRLVESEGPALRFLLGAETEVPLRVLQELAIGFILFGIGASFRFPTFREVGPRVVGVSAAEIGITSLLVGGTVYAATGDWRLGVIAPALAVSSAPSATLVTLREIEAEGPTSRCLILCVGHNNLIVLLAFPLLLSLAFGVGDPGEATISALIALAGGGAIGFGAAVWLESITGRREMVLLGILAVLAPLGLAQGGRQGERVWPCWGVSRRVSRSPTARHTRTNCFAISRTRSTRSTCSSSSLQVAICTSRHSPRAAL